MSLFLGETVENWAQGSCSREYLPKQKKTNRACCTAKSCKTSCSLNVSDPSRNLSVKRRSRCKAPLIAFNHWLWMTDSVSILSGFVITRFTRRFHIVCQATETRIANSLPFCGKETFLTDSNLTRLHPKIRPQFKVGHWEYFLDQSSRVRSQINFWPDTSHSNAMCSKDSGTPQAWHRPYISSVSMWDQKSPSLNVLCMHFHRNSRVKHCRVAERIDLQIVSSEGVYRQTSWTDQRMRSRFINVVFRWGLGCRICITL
jgi:hypothetical protein